MPKPFEKMITDAESKRKNTIAMSPVNSNSESYASARIAEKEEIEKYTPNFISTINPIFPNVEQLLDADIATIFINIKIKKYEPLRDRQERMIWKFINASVPSMVNDSQFQAAFHAIQ